MINSISKPDVKESNDLSSILEPVEAELILLEKSLIDDLTVNSPLLDKITKHIVQAGGKRIRPAVTYLFSKALNKGHLSSDQFQLGIALEMVHTATLIHDDVIDNAETRRGVVTLNKKWDDKTAVVAGDFLFARSLAKLSSIRNYLVIDIFANIMSDVCVGEIQQGNQSFEIITLEQYIEKSERKTAKLFIAGIESAAILTPDVNNMIIKASRDYAKNLGIAFQIVDDILNFTASEKKAGKPKGIDLKGGILTAPVLFALKEYEEKRDFRLKRLIENEFRTSGEFDTALDLVLKSNGIKKAKNLACNYINLASCSLGIIEDNPSKRALNNLAFSILDRNS